MDVNGLLARAKVQVLETGPSLLDDLRGIASDLLRMQDLPRSDVLAAIVDLVRERDVKSLVIEFDYVDADYLQTYSQHYSKAFRPKQPTCRRIHFFATTVSEASVFSLTSEQKSAYLGYCVLRPTGHQFIGRTVIVPPASVVTGDGLVHASTGFDAHLLGQRLTVSGMPFIQQDANTFICAGAALWAVGLFLHRSTGTPRFFPGQITDMALRRFSLSQLRGGLTVAAMVMTLREMGLNPHVEAYYGLSALKNQRPEEHAAILARICDFASVFADSGLPPILAFSIPTGGHAVAVAGHDVWELPLPPDPTNDLVRSWAFIKRFFVMDDAAGPYRPVFTSGVAGAGGICLDDLDHIAVIAPVPPEVVIDSADAFQEVDLFLSFWNALMDRLSADTGEPGFGECRILAGAGGPPVIRRVLMDSRHWKQCVVESGMPAWLKAQYQAMLLPKYVWVLELSDWRSFSKPVHTDRRLAGEVLLDATANPHMPFDSVLSIHAKGLLYFADPLHPEFASGAESFVPYAPVCKPGAC